MAETSKFFDIVITWLFAGAIVALGAKELHQRYSHKIHARSGNVYEMLRALHGEVDSGKAMISRDAISDDEIAPKGRTNHEDVKGKYSGDQLDRKDRQALDKLLNEF